MKALYLVFAVGFAAAPAAGRAQDPPKQFEQVFDQVIPKPSGQNGYEELVLAADLAKANPAFNELQQLPPPGPTLSAIRKVLAERDLLRARELLRIGLSKPVGSPRAKLDDETRLPELSGFRNLARMLNFQLYVDFADGRPDRAITTLRECLRFGYVVQTDSLISGLVGIAIDMIALRRFGDHLEQLSAADCDRLLVVVREWLRLQDPMIGVFNAERQGMQAMLRKYRDAPEKLIQALGADPNSDEHKMIESALGAVRSNPTAVGAIFDQAGAKMDAHFDRLMAEMRKPTWERQEPPAIEDQTPAGKICNMILPTLGQVTDRYAREQAEVQMLGLYAAICRYRWEHLALPPTLEVLKLGSLALDPFTGKPFTYKIISEKHFELGSAGPVDRSADSPTAGKRVPVTLPMRRP